MARRVAAAAALLAAVGAVVSSAQPRAPRPLAIVHVGVVDVERAAVVPDATVVIAGDRIASVESGAAASADAVVVDGRGRFLMPGLWDMHVHLSYARASALPAFVANGVTSVRDLGSDLSEIDRWRAQIDDGTLIGPAILRAGPILNGREFNPYQLAITDATEARMAVRTLRKAGVDVIKMHRQTPRDAYLAAADEARRLGVPFCGHVPVTMTPADASDARPASIEHTVTLFEGTFAEAHKNEDLPAAIARWRTTDADALFARFVRNATPVDATLIALEHVVGEYESGSADSERSLHRRVGARARSDGVAGAGRPGGFCAAAAAVSPRARAGHRPDAPRRRDDPRRHRHQPSPSAGLQRARRAIAAGPRRPLGRRGAARRHRRRGAPVPVDARRRRLDRARADLVLLDANPLDDVRHARRVSGVILNGRYFDRAAVEGLLRETERLAAVN